MGAIDNFLKRWGFAKLDRYGLVLTADDRVISTRPAILDDGLGGKIVGWLEDDLAAMELERWGASKPARPKRLTAPASLHKLPSKQAPLAAKTIAPAAPAPAASAPPAPAPRVETPAPAPILASTARPLPGVAPIIAPPAAPEVAETDEPGEDEWEWEIAMARARAAAEEEQAPKVRAAPAPRSRKMIMGKTSPGIAAVPATTPKLLHPEPEPLPPWPGTEPYNESWADKSEVAPQVMSVLQKKLALQRSTPARATPIVAPAAAQPRSTVIPVPQLPTAADPRSVRPAAYSPSTSRARVARGTGAPATKLEETVQTLAAPPAANDDRTSPYITLPNEVKPSGFAHTKRVAAKER